MRPPRTWEGLGCGKGLWIKSLGLGVVLLAAESTHQFCLVQPVPDGRSTLGLGVRSSRGAGKEMGRGGQEERSQGTLSREGGSSTGRQLTQSLTGSGLYGLHMRGRSPLGFRACPESSQVSDKLGGTGLGWVQFH